MKYKDETPGNLGGLSDVLSAEVLKMINELLEQLQRAGHINNGSKIELVYVAPGAQHVETQILASPVPLQLEGVTLTGGKKDRIGQHFQMCLALRRRWRCGRKCRRRGGLMTTINR